VRQVLLAIFPLAIATALQGAELIEQLRRENLTASQNSILYQISRLATTDGSVQIVRIDPALLLERSQFTLALPGRSPVTVEASKKTFANDRVSLVGRVSGSPNGTATMVVSKDSVTGSIQTDTGLYRITPLGNGAHAIVKTGRFPAEHPQ